MAKKKKKVYKNPYKKTEEDLALEKQLKDLKKKMKIYLTLTMVFGVLFFVGAIVSYVKQIELLFVTVPQIIVMTVFYFMYKNARKQYSDLK